VIGGIVMLYHGTQAIYWHGVSDAAHSRAHPRRSCSSRRSKRLLRPVQLVRPDGPNQHLKGVQHFKDGFASQRLPYDVYYGLNSVRGSSSHAIDGSRANAPSLPAQLMARIILGSYFVAYPVGGTLVCPSVPPRFRMLGHDVYVVERAAMSTRASTGSQRDDGRLLVRHRAVHELLSRFDLADRWCYIDAAGAVSRTRARARPRATRDVRPVHARWRTTHEAWHEESAQANVRVVVDGDPGFGQIWFAERRRDGIPTPALTTTRTSRWDGTSVRRE